MPFRRREFVHALFALVVLVVRIIAARHDIFVPFEHKIFAQPQVVLPPRAAIQFIQGKLDFRMPARSKSGRLFDAENAINQIRIIADDA